MKDLVDARKRSRELQDMLSRITINGTTEDHERAIKALGKALDLAGRVNVLVANAQAFVRIGDEQEQKLLVADAGDKLH